MSDDTVAKRELALPPGSFGHFDREAGFTGSGGSGRNPLKFVSTQRTLALIIEVPKTAEGGTDEVNLSRTDVHGVFHFLAHNLGGHDEGVPAGVGDGAVAGVGTGACTCLADSFGGEGELVVGACLFPIVGFGTNLEVGVGITMNHGIEHARGVGRLGEGEPSAPNIPIDSTDDEHGFGQLERLNGFIDVNLRQGDGVGVANAAVAFGDVGFEAHEDCHRVGQVGTGMHGFPETDECFVEFVCIHVQSGGTIGGRQTDVVGFSPFSGFHELLVEGDLHGVGCRGGEAVGRLRAGEFNDGSTLEVNHVVLSVGRSVQLETLGLSQNRVAVGVGFACSHEGQRQRQKQITKYLFHDSLRFR